MGLHQGFVQIGTFNVMDFDRSKALAKFWKDNLAKILAQKVMDKKHENFTKFLEDGGELSYLQLKRLNTIYKNEYIEHVL